MLNDFSIAVIVGTLLGILAGLGTGGGSLLVLWLTLALNFSQANAQAINLMFFLPSALICCLFRWKQGRLELKKVLPAIVTGSLSAGVFAFLGLSMDTSLLRKLFGGLLIFTGIRELLYRPNQC